MDSGAGSVTSPVTQLALGSIIATASQPMTMAKVLIQIGHEPVPPAPTTSIFGRQVLIYPNAFKYIGHIRRRDGFLGLYRGLGARILAGAVASNVTSHVSRHLGQKMNIKAEVDIENEELLDSLKRICKESTHETVSRCLGTIASQPFQVIMVRTIAQFVGREEAYNSIYSSICEIYQTEGLKGFFAGLAPRLLGEAVTIWAVNFLVHAINKYLIPKDDSPAVKGLKSYTNAICTMFVTHFTYPFTLVSNVMIVSRSSLAAGSAPHMPTYDDWGMCWNELKFQGQLKRGAGMFFRYYSGPVSLRHDGKPMVAYS